ncbi:MAG: acyl-CoA dehydrogenase [Deltaproteobacteria bacterium RIFCSPLOWO2_12_FULL_40_28]|nr:MAG: acyl-CoA dehydrogenase [Deltaproteobacteria bacterium RIFCSPHIGHO2_02_FULL_40_28]OGQ19350.1 MAG: acyl-CoA dehydrogenase [Deltaproteobacteria bacterium RIFCSPHIGHO2_12_FULL_40_32]OGQ40426.1 MAG: acyl-CoA dehydrogenase [Deltaproteobacteria bacterium RIFCSPLOWO2_02_FULL_40_36]OGQ53662.1 MAG: acyl-CoA dehydrogenase [Deltaproteobacteria bacterium RIFCSPLOWO2_12_FULL_40_28]
MHHKNRSYFTEDHEIFRKSVRTFVEKELLPHQKEWEEKKFVPKEIFKKLGDQGFLGINYPAEYGGSGCDLWYKVVFAEEMTHARMNGFAMDVFVQTDITSPVIEKLGTPEQKKEILEPAIKGEKILALGVTEPSGGSDVARIRTTAKKVGNEYVINGSKTFITNGSRADYIVLAVRTGGSITDKETFKNAYQGLSFILFPTKTEDGKTRPGFSVGRKLLKMGNDSSDTAELSFSDCKVPAKYLLGEENKGFYYIMQNFQGERLITAVMSVASSRQLWNDAVAYLNERQAFGRRLADFQVWQHRFAQWAAEIEAAQELTYRAVDLYNRKIPCVKEITMAKLITTELVNKLAYDCVQAHGGYGYMAEYDVSRIFRDVRLLTIGAGASEIMREIIVKETGLMR